MRTHPATAGRVSLIRNGLPHRTFAPCGKWQAWSSDQPGESDDW